MEAKAIANLGPLAHRNRSRLAPWLRNPVVGLDLYQWIGLAIAVVVAGAATWLGLRALERVACHALQRGGFTLDRATVASRRPGAGVPGRALGNLPGSQLWLLDLPATVVGVLIPTVKVVWIGLMAWTFLRLIDLGMMLYARSERLHDRRSLSDAMIVPTRPPMA